ncbi:MAG: S-methyl-5-thioribose-1-phosphate isomerase [Bacteroidota bacterium]|jgi:methylthioribose-1-phosphate isomerase
MKSIEWLGSSVRFIDQAKLPLEEAYITTDDYSVLAEAIRTLKIRGAPAIGIAAAYAVALASLKFTDSDVRAFRSHVRKAMDELASTRPTAVNLSWALNRMQQVAGRATTVVEGRDELVQEAISIHREDADKCRRIGEHGLALIPPRASILTYCNTGALATGGEGTALSIITTAHRCARVIRVFACETRPALQGARLTTWELMRAGIEVTLITDNAAASLMQQKKIDLIIVGADRIAANGDTANKIGTYNLAVLARYHGIPLYVAAPTSTIDASMASGEEIPLEQRSGWEVAEVFGKQIAPAGVQTLSPAFDVTPSELISVIITEDGIYRPPFNFSGSALAGNPSST